VSWVGQKVLGAVQTFQGLTQQGWPLPPQVPHTPALQVAAAGEIWQLPPLATQIDPNGWV
jgi:hypothetical protein